MADEKMTADEAREAAEWLARNEPSFMIALARDPGLRDLLRMHRRAAVALREYADGLDRVAAIRARVEGLGRFGVYCGDVDPDGNGHLLVRNDVLAAIVGDGGER